MNKHSVLSTGSVRAVLVGALMWLGAGIAGAQQAAPAQAAPAATPPAAEAAAKPAAAAPTLAPGSTAAVGWNNPPKWSDVEAKPQYASVPGREMNVLMEDTGHWWRSLRNGPVTFYGGVAILAFPILLLVFYAIKGSFKLHDKPTGRLIERFNSVERMSHWTMAISFVLLSLTGLSILFGKYVLLPLLGPSVFGWLLTVGKNIHNFVGPLFLFSIILVFFIFVKDNFFEKGDMGWLAKFGGMLSGTEIPSGRFNAAEKVWFWLGVVLLGVVVSASGVIMLFPNWDTVRELMAEANLVHAIAALVFATLSLSHIYLGTIGTEGAFKGMREGYVDETWAREHHQLWYEEVKAGKRSEKITGAAPAAAGDD